MRGIQVVEVLAALSLTTDLASGVSFEKGLRTCAVATASGRELGLPRDELSVVFHTALVRAIGARRTRRRTPTSSRTTSRSRAG